MPYLFSPPQRKQIVILAGRSLRYSYPVSSTVYKKAGVWVAVETPSTDDLNAADQVLAVTGRPQILDDVTGAAILAQGLSTLMPGADIPATCEPIWAPRE